MPNIFTLTAPSIGYKKSISVNIIDEETKYVVEFKRIDHSYKGQFGFDWMREAWLDEAKGICVEGLEELKKNYTPFPMDIKNWDGQTYGDYYVPWLTMFPNHKEKIGKEVELAVFAPIEYVADDIDTFQEKFTLLPTDKSIRIEPSEISLSTANNGQIIKIYCDKAIEKDAAIEVKSSKGALVGKLNILKNANQNKRIINIPVVFSYLVDKDLAFGKEIIENEIKAIGGLQAIEDYLNKQCLNQALIQVKLQLENPYDWGFSKRALKIADLGKNPRNNKGWDENEYDYKQFEGLIVDEANMKVDSGKMLNFFHHQFSLKETLLVNKKSDIILYLTSLNSDSAGGVSFAVPLDNKHCIIFKNNLDHLSSYGHEIAHTLGLLHTFPEAKYAKENQENKINQFEKAKKDAQDYLTKHAKEYKDHPVIDYQKSRVERNGKIADAYKAIFKRDKYKFKQKNTENIMDYDLKNQISFMKFQWEIMQEETQNYYN